MKRILYFGRKPWAETAGDRERERQRNISEAAALAAVLGLFAEARAEVSARSVTVEDGRVVHRDHLVICNGAFQPEGTTRNPWRDDWLDATIASIKAMWPDHANMRLVLRVPPQLRRWEVCEEFGYEYEAGQAWYMRLHAESLSARLTTEEDFAEGPFEASMVRSVGPLSFGEFTRRMTRSGMIAAVSNRGAAA